MNCTGYKFDHTVETCLSKAKYVVWDSKTQIEKCQICSYHFRVFVNDMELAKDALAAFDITFLGQNKNE